MSIRVKSYSRFTPVKVGEQRMILRRSGTSVPGAGCYENSRKVVPDLRFESEALAQIKATELTDIARIENG